jgi:hypothetical protein
MGAPVVSTIVYRYETFTAAIRVECTILRRTIVLS